jgi:predicted RNA-binding protein associated with RNAse of E/G family
MDIKIYRKRYIPNETILLKDDIILSHGNGKIVTKWNVLKPRNDFSHGYSCYYIKEGYKVSCFLKEDGSLIYYYCDIIKAEYKSDENVYIFTDLLADVKVYPDKTVKIVDLDELADALEKKLITQKELCLALRQLNSLLKIIYSGGIKQLIPEI